MDYSSILEELNKASTFDLYRLQVAINQQLKNHQEADGGLVTKTSISSMILNKEDNI
ncbi:MAG: hypothetical protein Q3M30_12175 [Candidatus Electrothrix sp. Rat3]|nr:hypothetical protein [Candidatus Electrothrix rattekaaiensis]